MNKFSVLFSLLFIFAIAACNDDKEPTNIKLSLKSAEIIKCNNEFGFNLFSEIINQQKADKNIMVSPLSVSQAMSMALNGAQNQTLIEMQSTLGFEGFSKADANKSNQEIVNALLDHDPKVDLKVANSVWYRNDFTVKSDFINNNKTYYNAEVASFDGADPNAAMKKMNSWVEKNTKGKIPKIIDNIESNEVLFLINAVYFKADWKTQFKKSNTQLKPFTLDNGTKIEVQTMIGEVELSYYNDEKFSVIKLPYSHGKFNLLIYLPEEGYTTSDIASDLSTTNFKLLRETLLSKRIIWLPKFEFTFDIPLISHMQQMGIVEAFDSNKADFSDISEAELYISKVMHKTYIKTDEEGSEAAAATSVSFGFTSVGPSEVIKIDRSFLFAIVEDDTESILFVGRVANPLIH